MPQSRSTRRSFLGQAALTAAATPLLAQHPGRSGGSSAAGSWFDLLRYPDLVTAFTGFAHTFPAGSIDLARNGDAWQAAGISVETKPTASELTLTLTAPSQPIALIHLRWNLRVPRDLLVLGDAWERSYGDLGWRNVVPERVLPWYFATHDGTTTHGYGVRTGARALCFWQVDQQGVSLWLNTTNGGEGVLLGGRRLQMATIVAHRGDTGTNPATHPVAAVTALCQALCSRPARACGPIYGANDWNYAYGASTAESILNDTAFMVSLAPTGAVRPFSVIDGGWEAGTKAWPDMAALAAGIRQAGARPGIWIRPLEAPAKTSPGLLLPAARFGDRRQQRTELAFDPTLPEARELIADKVRQVTGWQYEMIKHDFSTYDLLGQWGFEMGPQPTFPGWSFADRTRTNAEVLSSLYALIRSTAGDQVVLNGCNTFGHLTQGLFEIQRTGDDTSGRQWERTRRMGINTLAFRIPQNRTFFTIDPDLAGITDAIPWELNRQWLQILALSGVSTMISPGPPARGAEQRDAIRQAFAIAAAGGLDARPEDWLTTTAPEHWRARDRETTFDWNGPDGTSPFLGP